MSSVDKLKDKMRGGITASRILKENKENVKLPTLPPMETDSNKKTDIVVVEGENVNINVNKKKLTDDKLFEENYKRVTFYIRRVFIKELTRLSKIGGKGAKTRIINDALENFIRKNINVNINVNINNTIKIGDEYDSATFFIRNDVLELLNNFATTVGGKGAKTRTVINAALQDVFTIINK